MLSAEQFQQLFPHAPEAHRSGFLARATGLFHHAGLHASAARCHFFLAQLGHESHGLHRVTENLSYSAIRLTQIWPARFPRLEDARPFAHDPEALAERVYGGRLGNSRPGDGYRYRGRGYLQLTGRENYRAVGEQAGLPLEAQPELAADPGHALAVACAVWSWKGLNPLCDAGNFTGLSRRINGGLVGLQDRYDWLARAQRCLPWPGLEQIRALQRLLRARGLYDGSIDGILGRRSLAGLAALRAECGLPPGGLDGAVLALLPSGGTAPSGARAA
ncbi:glycoside hydrolase family 19 [Pseudoroseomonas rhizosphaerae]|uniref:Glycoside hydrolase family 19 n=1 Tax=Teichococcus rhizosphaerae TaxID=1335062 RepID=A0A2C7AGE8_9PROT|nr:peptidoglycan-binding protein [Pseudoroseomonas rhizosphaerae]PHK96763.1 glycoside hydrolase family 19 [Pseudoroseomonas rhizosphaerae]